MVPVYATESVGLFPLFPKFLNLLLYFQLIMVLVLDNFLVQCKILAPLWHIEKLLWGFCFVFLWKLLGRMSWWAMCTILSFSLPVSNCSASLNQDAIYGYSGGERRVVELLENESKEPLLGGGADNENKKKKNSFWKFLCEPYVLGRELFVIEKFGLVQYVSQMNYFYNLSCVFLSFFLWWSSQMILKTFCAFLTFLLELLGVYGDGEFKWYYGYVNHNIIFIFCTLDEKTSNESLIV